MSRKKRVIKKRLIKPDGKFNSVMVSKLINKVMWDGKATQAKNIVYQSLDYSSKKLNQKPLPMLEEIAKSLKLELETKKWKFGGANRLVPKKIGSERSLCLALRWLVWAARKKKKGKMSENLAQEIIAVWEDQKTLKEAEVSAKEFKPKSEAFKKKQIEQKKVIESIAFASFNTKIDEQNQLKTE